MILWFSASEATDVEIAGGKGASLAAMTAAGFPVPAGFILPSHLMLQVLDAAKLATLARSRDHAGAMAYVREAATVPDEVLSAYDTLGGKVAVRSSASAEDSDAASYAGQQETFLAIEGREAVREAVVECWASFFSERAIFYRGKMGSLDDLRMAVVVQEMVPAEKAGVMFTVHPITRRKDRMMIEAVHGLGEQVVSGEVTPAQYVVDRKGRLKKTAKPGEDVLDAAELTELSGFGQRLAEHYGVPQDIEWAIASGRLYLLQSRPITTL
ncbi:PEP/pyruvate-binding domain-containing protein [Chelativorans sp. M5D2P16]|uniref:PEP/pyruvate-binding domain-containing protein n=1 Tax=Chelativorans sp. M5D2P16 TaxID=3095678 RepID=UPI002ACABDF7|nr:PEP/pyruvate-binding domain-containing protein [Chelativorans sp. M5D2P16]MDZ5697453.1 PEP/pyruvate-binding domain-containing protein [Chelativorans sp. M5D2P16]